MGAPGIHTPASPRARSVALTIVFVAWVLAFMAWTHAETSLDWYSVTEFASGAHTPGKRVAIRGVVERFEPGADQYQGTYVLVDEPDMSAPQGAPRVRVRYTGSTAVHLEPGSLARFVGRVEGPLLVASAEVLAVGPSKAQEADEDFQGSQPPG